MALFNPTLPLGVFGDGNLPRESCPPPPDEPETAADNLVARGPVFR